MSLSGTDPHFETLNSSLSEIAACAAGGRVRLLAVVMVPVRSVAELCGIVVATGTATLALAALASAKAFVQDSYIDVPQCQPATSQLCPQIPTASIGAITAPTVSFTANSNHCSDIIAHVFIDGVEFGSDLLEPGETTPEFPLADCNLTRSGSRPKVSRAAATPVMWTRGAEPSISRAPCHCRDSLRQ